MNYKKQIYIFLLLAVILIGIWVVGALCLRNNLQTCVIPYLDNPFFDFTGPIGLVVILSTLPLLFLKEKVYKAWRIFALWAIPLSLLWIFLTPVYGSGGILSTGREYITFLVSGLFLTISYLLIIYKAWRYRE